MRHFRQVFAIFFLAIALIAWSGPSTANAQAADDSESQHTLDTSPIRDLLHVLDVIMEENPDYESNIERIRLGSSWDYDAMARVHVLRNESSVRIARLIDSLFATPAYQLCFQQYTFVTPEWYRKYLLGLPYLAVDGPGGGIGDFLKQLCEHRAEMTEWYDNVIARVDLDRCIETAKQWLPPGEYAVPKTYFVYGFGGDAFARDEMVGFDLYGVVLSELPAGTRFENLDRIGTDEIEAVLAHEIHHVYAYRLLDAASRDSMTPEQRYKRRVVRGLIAEGAALLCNPPDGMKRLIWEDSATARAWIGAMDSEFTAIDSGRVSDSLFNQWMSDSYFFTARRFLSDFLARRFAGQNQDSLFNLYTVNRPDLQHMLGAWMVSHISDGGKNREKVIQLLSRPDSLFSWYNAAMGTGDSTLLVNASPR